MNQEGQPVDWGIKDNGFDDEWRIILSEEESLAEAQRSPRVNSHPDTLLPGT